MFTKILIANRGEIAVRIIQACQVLGIRSVAVFSESDSNALHVRRADEAVLIGPSPSGQSYLRGERLIQVAHETGCQAIHPGYGFLSENAAFAEAVRAAGLVFIGPSAAAIRRMGSKTEARHLMTQAGVPVVPGFQGAEADFSAEAQRIGYPVLVKAAAGGGGKGMRVVTHPKDLPESIAAAQREAANAFGDSTLFMEKYLPIARHIEFQILADTHGQTLHLFERECSIQRRHQKIIEETPSPFLTESLRAEMGAAAVAAAKAVDYHNAGTIEFIVDEAGHFYFLEMNTRLQVEHPITEMVSGLDLVAWQIRIAAGERLPFQQHDLTQRGHAIECRLYAEDPANDFLPSIGTLLQVHEPHLPRLRLDKGVETGDSISIHYDPLLAKMVAHAATRAECIALMQAALAQYHLLGVTTNRAFLRDVLAHPAFAAGQTTTQFIDQHFQAWQPAPPNADHLDWALLAAAVMDLHTQAAPLASSASSPQGDPYSPWERLDHFRLGQGS